MNKLILLALLWTLFFTSHSVLADFRVKQFLKKIFEKLYPYYRLAYNIFSVMGLLIIFLFQWSLKGNYFWKFSFWNYTGFLLMFFGVLIAIIAFKDYNTEEFIGTRQLEKAFEPESETLKIGGMHHWVRHPLYFGTILLLLGYWIWQPNDVNTIFVGVAFFIYPLELI